MGAVFAVEVEVGQFAFSIDRHRPFGYWWCANFNNDLCWFHVALWPVDVVLWKRPVLTLT